MNVAVSLVLAVASILSTFMLQLGDESGNAALVVGTSFFAILGAAYFVDYKKTFAEPKFVANVLMLLVVFSQFGSLARSREEFLAFSIANILVFIEAIIFYRRKTIRICYQILTISFVKVAVGCVFQRSGLFAFLLPLYGVAAFGCFSLLLLEHERKYYSCHRKLSPRFDARGFRPLQEENEEVERRKANKAARKEKSKRTRRLAAFRAFSSSIFGTAGNARTPGIDGTASVSKSSSGIRFALLTEPTKFLSLSGAKTDLGIDGEFFRRFVFSSVWALAFAAFFFCFFPRFHRLEIGGIEFGRDGWNAGSGAVRSTTGFSSKIELGELGPAADNPEPILSIRFVDVFDPKRAPVSPHSLVYLRGIPLARYADRTWEQVDWEKGRTNRRLRLALESSEPIVPASELLFQDEPQSKPFGDPRFPRSPDFQRSLETFHRTPLFAPPQMQIPTTRSVDDLPSFERLQTILAPPENVVKSNYLFDSRSRLVGTEIVLEPLDTQILFAVWPFYSLRPPTNLFFANGGIATRPSALSNVKATYRFATNAFQNGIQSPLTPNQNVVWPYLDQYLALNVDRFPRLIELAKRWDDESNLPKNDFAGRARYLESKLRDVGEFRYDRKGVERNRALDPLEDFVSEHKSGHCEYFAGALALMLRAIGIPSQTVVGFAFYPKEGNEKTIIRQSDAHSWTEAFIPANKFPDADSPAGSLFPGNEPDGLPQGTQNWPQDGAWLRLDATPAARSDTETNALINVGASWLVFFQTIWRDYVLNFNGATQAKNIYRPIVECWKTTLATIRDFRTGFRPLASFAEKAKEIAEQIRVGDWSPRAVGNALGFFARIAIALYLVVRLVVFFRDRRKKRQNGAAKRRKPAAEKAFALYRRVEKTMARRLVVERRPNETPREFLERCFALEDRASFDAETQQIAETKNDVQTRNKIENAVKFQTGIKNASAASTFERTSNENRRVFREIVERYYRARFGEVALSPEETTRWNAALRELGID